MSFEVDMMVDVIVICSQLTLRGAPNLELEVLE